MSQINHDSLKTDFSVCDVSQSNPDLTSHDTVGPGVAMETGVNGNSESLSDEAFKLKLDDLGLEVEDHDNIERIDRLETLEDTRHSGTDQVGWLIE